MTSQLRRALRNSRRHIPTAQAFSFFGDKCRRRTSALIEVLSRATGVSGAARAWERYWALLGAYLRPQWRRVVLLAVLLLVTTGLQLAIPQILRYFIDAATSGGTGRALMIVAGLFLGVTLLDQVLWVGVNYVGENVGWTATNAVRADLATHCLDLDMSFHNARTPGELIERIDGDPTALSNFFSQLVILVIGNGLLLLGILGSLFREDWRIGLVLTAFAAFVLYVLQRVRNLAVPYFAADRQASAEVYGFVEERLSGVVDIHANGAQPHVMRRFHEFMRMRYRRGRSAFLAGNVMFRIADALFTLGYVVALALGAALFRAGAITLGTVYLIFHFTEMLRFPLEQITRQMQDFQKASASIGRIQQLRELRTNVADGPGVAFPRGPLAVEFAEVSFGYSLDELVLHDLSFRVDPGQVLGVLGRTRSGKTTLTRLLFRFYDVRRGAILVGGHDVRRLRLADLHHGVAIVTQDVQLFNGTVRDNLSLFDPGIADARILHVVEELGLSTWLYALPEGLDTELASGGKGLSAGEAQLLALARVFLRDPGLVILDEASSRLDPATEQMIEQALDRLLDGRTGIVIAHRLATVQRAHDILILENGRLQEYGSRHELARDAGSRFASLLRAGMEEVLA